MDKPASIAELSAPVETLATAVSVASGKKQTLSLPSTSGTYDADQKQPTKDQVYYLFRLYPYRINTVLDRGFFESTVLLWPGLLSHQ